MQRLRLLREMMPMPKNIFELFKCALARARKFIAAAIARISIFNFCNA